MIIIDESLIVILIFSSIIIFAYAIRSFLFIFIIIIYPALLSLIVINHIYFLIKIKFSFLKKNLENNNTFSTSTKNIYLYIENRIRNKISNNKLILMKKNQITFLAKDTNRFIYFSPFISILIASHNEKIVIEKLLSSLSKISYNPERLEIIIIDDSDDGTYETLNIWQTEIPKLKVIHRKNRTGWKGGALNLGIKNINENSDIVLIVDADNILEKYTLKKIAKYFREQQEMGFSVSIVQGFPNPIVFPTYKKSSTEVKLEHKRDFIHENINNNNNSKNWVSKGITFRLYQRNLIEFLAKEKLNLPLQITGSLFAISTSLLKSLGLSHDICEDWDLTLDIFLCEVSNNIKSHKANNNNDNNKVGLLDYDRNNEYNNKNKKINKKIIAFEPSLVSYTEVTKSILTYFKQRMRVSEGHTRGFIIRIIKIIKCDKITLLDKIELFFVGLRYVKYIFIILMISIDIFLLNEKGIDGILTNNFIKISLWLQSLSLILYIIFNLLSLKHDYKIGREKFEINYIIYLLGVNIFTIPALAIGSLLGFVRTKGNFYNTKRNE